MGPDWILRVSVPFCHKSYIICQAKLDYNNRSINLVLVPLTKVSCENIYIIYTDYHTHNDTLSIHCSTVKPPWADTPRSGHTPYSGQCGNHGLKIPFMLYISYLREATTSKLRTADTFRVPTALSRTFLPLNSGHPEATPLKLSGASPLTT